MVALSTTVRPLVMSLAPLPLRARLPLNVVVPVPVIVPPVHVDAPATVSEPVPAIVPPARSSDPMPDAAAKLSVPALSLSEPVPLKLLIVKLVRTSVLKAPSRASSATPGRMPPVQLPTTSQKLPGPMKLRGAAFRPVPARASRAARATGWARRLRAEWARRAVQRELQRVVRVVMAGSGRDSGRWTVRLRRSPRPACPA